MNEWSETCEECSLPYGQAKCFVQSQKQVLKDSMDDGRSLEPGLYNHLLMYHSPTHLTTGVTPSSLFLNRHRCIKFDMLRPNVASHVVDKQSSQKASLDCQAKERSWTVGQSMLTRSLHSGLHWVPATILKDYVQ